MADIRRVTRTCVGHTLTPTPSRMTTTVVAADDWPHLTNDRGVRGWAQRQIAAYAAERATRVCEAQDGTLLLASDATAEAIDPRRCRAISYNALQVPALLAADYEALYKFADAMVAAFDRAGLEHAGVSLTRVLEFRWLDPLFHKVLFHADTLSAVISQTRATRLVLLDDGSDIEQMLADVGRQQRLAVVVAGEGRIVHRMKQAMTAPRWSEQPAEFRRMIARDLSHLKEAARKDAFNTLSVPRVLFIGRMDRTVERLCAAVPSLLRSSEFSPALLYSWRVTLASKLPREVPCSSIYDWIGRGDAERIVRDVRVVATQAWQRVSKDAEHTLGHLYRGTPLFRAAKPLVEHVIREGAPRAALLVAMASAALDVASPSLVVSFEDGDTNRAFNLLSRQRGIPSLAYYVLSPAYGPQLVRRTQGWLAVSGESLRTAFSSQMTVHPERLRIVGDTLTDAVAGRSRRGARAQVAESLGLSPERPIVALLSTWVAPPIRLDDIRTVFTRTAAAVRDLPGAQLVIKVHPLQPVEQVRSWMQSWQCEGTVVRSIDLLDLSLAVDVVSAPTTTAIWQPMLAGTPVLCVQPRRSVEFFEPFEYGYLSGKGVVFVPEDQDAGPVLRSLLFDQGARAEQIERGLAHAVRHVGPIDGRAGERLRGLIEEILRARPEPTSAP